VKNAVSFVNVSTTDLSMIRKVDAAVVEMEAAAVAEVCAIYKAKRVALKAVTDDVEHPNVGQFSANLQLAATNLAAKLRKPADLPSAALAAGLEVLERAVLQTS
jgi:nucleoside phosphorylase